MIVKPAIVDEGRAGGSNGFIELQSLNEKLLLGAEALDTLSCAPVGSGGFLHICALLFVIMQIR